MSDFVIIAGHRRAAAAAQAGIREIPLEVRPELSENGTDIEVMAIENLHRHDLNAIEEAVLYQKLASSGRSQRQIAKRVGRAQSHVSKRLALLQLPEEVQASVASGDLDVSAALELPRLGRQRPSSDTGSGDQAIQLAAAPSETVLRAVPSASSPGTGLTTAAPQQRPRSRDECCARIACRRPTASAALHQLADAVLLLAPEEEALRLAHQWLRKAKVGPDTEDHLHYADLIRNSATRLRMQLACAVAFAADELNSRRSTEWGPRESAHLRRLMDEAQYIPTADEWRLLEQAEGAIPTESGTGTAWRPR